MASNVIVEAVSVFGKAHGFRKKYRTWWRRQEQTIAVCNVQGSQWGRQFYVNVGLWLLPLGERECPAMEWCHVQTRLGNLVERSARLKGLLDLEADIPGAERTSEIVSVLETWMLPVFEQSRTIDGLVDGRNVLLERSLVRGVAQELLIEWPIHHTGNL